MLGERAPVVEAGERVRLRRALHLRRERRQPLTVGKRAAEQGHQQNPQQRHQREHQPGDEVGEAGDRVVEEAVGNGDDESPRSPGNRRRGERGRAFACERALAFTGDGVGELGVGRSERLRARARAGREQATRRVYQEHPVLAIGDRVVDEGRERRAGRSVGHAEDAASLRSGIRHGDRHEGEIIDGRLNDVRHRRPALLGDFEVAVASRELLTGQRRSEGHDGEQVAVAVEQVGGDCAERRHDEVEARRGHVRRGEKLAGGALLARGLLGQVGGDELRRVGGAQCEVGPQLGP